MQYVSDIIGIREVKRWKDGDKVLISTPTGSGKTTFIFNVLYPYCVENNFKILYFSNRVALKNQIINEIKKLGLEKEYITVKNYQQSEKRFIDHEVTFEEIFQPYKFIIMDEAHYIIADSYNRKTDVFLDVLKYNFSEKIRVFITATPDAIMSIVKDFNYSYAKKQDFSFINHLYFYENETALDNIITNIPPGEKCVYFGKCEEGIRLKRIVPNSAFVCSKHNEKYFKYCRKDEYGDDLVMESIENDGMFEEDFLFCTQVLDNGISLHDPKIKHIIIDQIDPIIFMQCLGRKRLEEGETITVYVKEYNKRSTNGYLKQVNDALAEIELAERLGPTEFLKQYRRKRFDTSIFSDGTINLAKKAELLYKASIYSKDSFQRMYGDYMAKMLKQTSETTSRIDDEMEISMLENLMQKYEGFEMVAKEEKDKFQEMFFQCVFKSSDHRGFGFKTMNAILEDKKVEYHISTATKRFDGEVKRYWIVQKGNLA